MYDFQSKVAFITGGSEGIGYAIAHAFATRGARCVLVARTEEKLKAAVSRLPGQGHMYVPADVTNYTQVEFAVSKAAEAYGRIDILVNNAGVFELHPIDTFPPEELERIVKTNLLGPMYVTRAVTPLLRKQREGIIVHVLSQAARMVLPGDSAYGSAKWGHRAFAEHVNVDLPFVRNHCIYPGIVDTKVWRGSATKEEIRAANPQLSVDEVANAVLEMLDKNITDYGIEKMMDGTVHTEQIPHLSKSGF